MGASPFERKKQAKQEETYAKSKQSLPTVIVCMCVCVYVGVSMRVCLCASVTIFNAITVQHSSRESNRQNNR